MWNCYFQRFVAVFSVKVCHCVCENSKILPKFEKNNSRGTYHLKFFQILRDNLLCSLQIKCFMVQYWIVTSPLAHIVQEIGGPSGHPVADFEVTYFVMHSCSAEATSEHDKY